MALAVLQLVKINMMRVKDRPVNACQHTFAIDHDAADAAKAHSVKHHHIENAAGGNLSDTCALGNSFHHGSRPGYNGQIHFLISEHPVNEFQSSHLFRRMENHVAVRLDISSEARGFRGKFRKDCHHSVAGLLQSFDHGDDGHETYTVATADHSTVVSDLERLSQRTEHITNPVIFVERTDQVGQTGTLVDYNGECAVGGRGIDDSKRDAGAKN